MGDLASAIIVNLPYQLAEAAWHHPLGAIAVIWWLLETIHLLRKLVAGLRKLRDRMRPPKAKPVSKRLSANRRGAPLPKPCAKPRQPRRRRKPPVLPANDMDEAPDSEADAS